MRSLDLLFGWLRAAASGEHEPDRARTGTQERSPAAPGQRDTCAPTQPMAAANSSLGSGGGHGRPARPPPAAGPPVGCAPMSDGDGAQ